MEKSQLTEISEQKKKEKLPGSLGLVFLGRYGHDQILVFFQILSHVDSRIDFSGDGTMFMHVCS